MTYGPSGPGAYDVRDDAIGAFNDAHGKCEGGCGERLCSGDLEACEGGCVSDCEAPGFTYDGHDFCAGGCADEARATLALDVAWEMLIGTHPACMECGEPTCSRATGCGCGHKAGEVSVLSTGRVEAQHDACALLSGPDLTERDGDGLDEVTP